MKNLLSILVLIALAMPTSLSAQTISQGSGVTQQPNEPTVFVIDLQNEGLIIGLMLAVIYLGIWVGSIVSVVKHPFKSWVPKVIWLVCILVFELPASFAWFIFRPRTKRASQVPPLATDPLAVKGARPEKVLMPKK